MTIERRAVIAAPLANVYALLANPDRLSEWREDLVSTERLSPPGGLDGSKYRETVRTPIGNQQVTVQLSTVLDKSFGFKVLDGMIRPEGSLSLQERPDGTEVVYKIALKPVFFIPSPADLAAGAHLTNSVDKSMKKLKEILETA